MVRHTKDEWDLDVRLFAEEGGGGAAERAGGSVADPQGCMNPAEGGPQQIEELGPHSEFRTCQHTEGLLIDEAGSAGCYASVGFCGSTANRTGCELCPL